MLTVASVLKSGGIYDATWVARLRAGVARHLPVEHRFLCLSDVPDLPCERIPLKHDWPGWWAKLEAFRLPGPVLMFDLDTAIVGDISDLARVATEARFAILRDFYRTDGLGSGVMAFRDADVVRPLYSAFREQWFHAIKALRGRGDQGFIEDNVDRSTVALWQDELPGQICSYKVHCRSGIPENARVVCLHGKPKFGDMPANDPVRLAWELAA
jgi:hypothetical protein